MQEDTLAGNGPWEFKIPSLDPAEIHNLDFRNMEYNGQKGYFRRFLPLDDLQVTNRDDGNPIGVEINHEYGGVVPPNTNRVFGDSGVTYLSVQNRGGATISSDTVVIEVSSSGYTQNDYAREQKKKQGDNPILNAARDIIPGGNSFL